RRVLRNELLSARGERISEIMAELASEGAVALQPSPEQTAGMMSEVALDCGRNLATLAKFETKRDCTQLREETGGELHPLSDFVVVQARKRAGGQLEGLYAPRWHRFLSRLDADRTLIVDKARGLHLDLNAANSAVDYQAIFNTISLAEPCLLKPDETEN